MAGIWTEWPESGRDDALTTVQKSSGWRSPAASVGVFDLGVNLIEDRRKGPHLKPLAERPVIAPRRRLLIVRVSFEQRVLENLAAEDSHDMLGLLRVFKLRH